MNQEIAISKIMTEIKERHLISSYADSDIEYYLTIAFAIGFDLGVKIPQRTGKPIGRYNKRGSILARYNSAVEAEIKTGISRSSISKVLLGITITAGGYYWKYLKSKN